MKALKYFPLFGFRGEHIYIIHLGLFFTEYEDWIGVAQNNSAYYFKKYYCRIWNNNFMALFFSLFTMIDRIAM